MPAQFNLVSGIMIAEAHAPRVRSLSVDYDRGAASVFLETLGAGGEVLRSGRLSLSADALDEMLGGDSFEAALLQLAVQHDPTLAVASGQVEVR